MKRLIQSFLCVGVVVTVLFPSQFAVAALDCSSSF